MKNVNIKITTRGSDIKASLMDIDGFIQLGKNGSWSIDTDYGEINFLPSPRLLDDELLEQREKRNHFKAFKKFFGLE